ncbi:unnamed protein product, partial [Didymodactylos carnosus]
MPVHARGHGNSRSTTTDNCKDLCQPEMGQKYSKQLSMSDFLASNNPCGQTILQLVATGNAIISELLRLSDYVPPVFKVANVKDAGKYGEIIFDFSYFPKQEYYDDLINGRPDLQDTDDEFRENNLTLLTRFYQAFESVHKYGIEFN